MGAASAKLHVHNLVPRISRSRCVILRVHNLTPNTYVHALPVRLGAASAKLSTPGFARISNAVRLTKKTLSTPDFPNSGCSKAGRMPWPRSGTRAKPSYALLGNSLVLSASKGHNTAREGMAPHCLRPIRATSHMMYGMYALVSVCMPEIVTWLVKRIRTWSEMLSCSP